MYAAEALVLLDQTSEALQHLSADLISNNEEQFSKAVVICCWLLVVVCCCIASIHATFSPSEVFSFLIYILYM